MALNKKAYFFSLTVLLIIGIAALIMSGARDPGHQRSATLANQRLTEINAFMNSIQEDATTAVRVATHRALLTAQGIVQSSGPLNDPAMTISTLIINGTYQEIPQPLLVNESLEDWASHLQPLANHLRITMTITINNVQVTQEDPWNVLTTTTIALSTHDNFTDSSWQQPFTTTVKTPITGLADPLYTIGTEGRYTQHIRNATTPIPNFGTHITNHHYIASDKAPRYLDRFTSNPTSSPQGIESLVDVSAVAAVNVNYAGSIIDWQYFGTNVLDTCSLPGAELPAWAVIENASMARYDLPPCS